MAEPVKSKNWRARRRETRHSHSSEVVRETLPKEVQELLLEMADKIARQAMEIVELKKDVDHLKTLVAGIGRVTLDDLVRKSA